MAFSSGFYPRDAAIDEPLYCSGPQNPEDIICPGSDSEQTPQEIYEKRRRYEKQAQRCLQNQLPVLLSASLRGPLESGWANPWRHRPRENPDRKATGSGDVLFNRENVKRWAAGHRLSHVVPAETTTRRRAEAKNRSKAQRLEDVDEAAGVDNLDSEYNIVEYPDDIRDSLPGDGGAVRWGSNSTRSVSPGQPVAAKRAGNRGGRQQGYVKTGTKRPADSQWLKGSYISKRARWDADTTGGSSPSPMPGIRGKPYRRPRFIATKPRVANTLQEHTNSQQRLPSQESQYSRSEGVRLDRQPEGSKTLQSDSRETTFAPAVDFLREPKRKELQQESETESIDDYDELDSSDALLLSQPGSTKLPTPRRPTNRATQNIKLREGGSFITEVAPSSQNLERFEYRKKRKRPEKRISSGFRQASRGDRSSSASSVRSIINPGPDGESSNIVLPNDGDASNAMFSNAKAPQERLMIVCPSQGAVHDEENVSPRSLKSDTSWDMMDDIQPHDETHVEDEALPSIEESTSPEKPSIYAEATDRDGSTQSPQFDSEGASTRSPHSQPPAKLGDMPQPQVPVDVEGSEKFGPKDVVTDPLRSPSPDIDSTQSDVSLHENSPRVSENAQRSPSKKLEEAHPINQGHNAADDTEGDTDDEMEPDEAPSTPNRYSPSAQPPERINTINNEPPEEKIQSQIRAEMGSPTDTEELRGNEIANELQPLRKASEEGEARSSQNSRRKSRSSSSQMLQSLSPTKVAAETIYCPVEVEGAGNWTQSDSHDPQDSPQRRGLQSPWATEYSEPVLSVVSRVESKDDGAFKPGENQASQGWQHPEDAAAPDTDGIIPFKRFMTPTPPPEPSMVCSFGEDLPSTQVLLEAAITNPWTQNQVPRKPKKRVSFAVLSSDEEGPEDTTSSNEVPMSPPPPQIIDCYGDDDAFNDGTTIMNKFRKHFAAATGSSRILSAAPKSSPVVSAMAEAFIAADHRRLPEQGRHQTSTSAASRHLKPISKTRANIYSLDNESASPVRSSSTANRTSYGGVKTIDYGMGIDFEDFLGGPGGILEEWSVETELKKAAKGHSEEGRASHRSHLGIMSRR